MFLFKLNLEGSKITLIKEFFFFTKYITGRINCGEVYSASIVRLSDNQGSLTSKGMMKGLENLIRRSLKDINM